MLVKDKHNHKFASILSVPLLMDLSFLQLTLTSKAISDSNVREIELDPPKSFSILNDSWALMKTRATSKRKASR